MKFKFSLKTKFCFLPKKKSIEFTGLKIILWLKRKNRKLLKLEKSEIKKILAFETETKTNRKRNFVKTSLYILLKKLMMAKGHKLCAKFRLFPSSKVLVRIFIRFSRKILTLSSSTSLLTVKRSHPKGRTQKGRKFYSSRQDEHSPRFSLNCIFFFILY